MKEIYPDMNLNVHFYMQEKVDGFEDWVDFEEIHCDLPGFKKKYGEFIDGYSIIELEEGIFNEAEHRTDCEMIESSNEEEHCIDYEIESCSNNNQ